MPTHRRLCMVQLDSSGETSLREQAQLGYNELVQLETVRRYQLSFQV
jgi:hypothetical protein